MQQRQMCSPCALILKYLCHFPELKCPMRRISGRSVIHHNCKTLLHVCYRLRTTVFIKSKLSKMFFEVFVFLVAIGYLYSCPLSPVNSVMYEVRASISLAVLLLCLGLWCPLVGWSGSINQVKLVLTAATC